MPRPSDVHVNKPLQNISIAYLQDQMDFVAPKVFPFVPVDKRSDLYFKFAIADFKRDAMQKRAPHSESAGADYDITNDSFLCEVYALHQDIDDYTRSNDDAGLVADQAITNFLTQQALIKFERLFASKFFTTGVWTGSSTGTDIVAGTKWNTAGSTPVADVRAQIRSIKNKTGFTPNFMVLNALVFDALADNADVLSRLGSNERGVLNASSLAQIFGVQNILIAEVSYNSANKGQVASMANVFGTDGALLGFAQSAPAKEVPSAGYVFADKSRGGNNYGLAVKKFRMEELNSDRIEVEFSLDPKVVCADCGAFFSDVI